MAITLEIKLGPDFIPIAEKLVEMDQPLPNPAMPCLAFTAVDDKGELVGFSVLSCIALIEPFHVPSESEGGMISARLFKYVEKYVRDSGVHRLFVHSDSAKMQKMIQRAGGRVVPEPCYEFRAEWMKEGN